MKKLILLILIVIFLAIGLIVTMLYLKINNPKEENYSTYQKVIDTIDGDTIDVENIGRVRLICVDSPERGQEFYEEAKEKLKLYLMGKKVRLEKDISDKDANNRSLRYVYDEDDRLVNWLIVKEGYAILYKVEPDISKCDSIEEVQNEAKNKGKGMWNMTKYNCSENTYNCNDFINHELAQKVFLYCGGSENDIHGLDGNNDGQACG